MSRQFDIAVVGATGLVGEALLELLADSDLPLGEVHLLASPESVGKRLAFRGHHLKLAGLEGFDFTRVQLVFLAVPAEVALTWAAQAAEAGAVVIDLSGALAATPQVPLVVPDINGELLADFRETNMVACPSPAALQAVRVLKPLQDAVGLLQVHATVLESASAAGRAGVEALARQTARLMNAQDPEPQVFERQLAFNCLPVVGELLEQGASRHEARVALELLRLLGEPALPLTVDASRVPVFFGTTVHLKVQPAQPLDAGQAAALLDGSGVRQAEGLATAVTDAVGDDSVWMSRLRRALSGDDSLLMTLVADNIRTGAAANAVEIGRLLIKDYL